MYLSCYLKLIYLKLYRIYYYRMFSQQHNTIHTMDEINAMNATYIERSLNNNDVVNDANNVNDANDSDGDDNGAKVTENDKYKIAIHDGYMSYITFKFKQTDSFNIKCDIRNKTVQFMSECFDNDNKQIMKYDVYIKLYGSNKIIECNDEIFIEGFRPHYSEIRCSTFFSESDMHSFEYSEKSLNNFIKSCQFKNNDSRFTIFNESHVCSHTLLFHNKTNTFELSTTIEHGYDYDSPVDEYSIIFDMNNEQNKINILNQLTTFYNFLFN